METFKFNSKIVGSTFRRGQEIIKTLSPGDVLVLRAEPDNKFDPNAILVLTNENETSDENQIGYIPKDTAAKIQGDVIAGSVTVKVCEITGGACEKANVGCNIELEITRVDKEQTLLVDEDPNIQEDISGDQ
jgi:hypothetical protein